MADLTTKTRVYGSAGWPAYWVVSPESVYVHTGPHRQGYRQRVEHRRGERVRVPGGDAEIAVDELIGGRWRGEAPGATLRLLEQDLDHVARV